MPTAAPAAAIPPRQVLLVFSGLLLTMLLAALDSTIVATALPTIVGELGGLERLGWVVTAYLLAQTVVLPLYGKLGDLYGRKIVLQSGIIVFLLGSALCGAARSMGQMIAFRALQGLGGGGLMVTSQAVVGDIVTPRERGKYQGIFGAVFGFSSIAGPLLGGYFTTHLSWRWIFYINLPLGVLALVVIALTLPARPERVRHRIDYAGAGLLALTLAALVLFADLGGVAYAWSSPPILGLAALAVAALLGFILAERRAAEPVLPLRLFRDRTFALAAAVGLIVGFALFGSVTFIPLFLQVVNGASPTGSGLRMLPMMGGMLLTSVLSGQLISRWGRYRVFPIAGTAVAALGLYLLSRMGPHTGITTAGLYMLVLGLGLGLIMQVLVIAVQNAVAYRDLGVATSGTMLFRLIGGSLGTALFGAIFASRLAGHLRAALPPGAELPGGVGPQAIARLAPELREVYTAAFTSSLGLVFAVAAGIALLGFVLAWLIPEHPLRESVAAVAGDVGHEAEDLFPLPTDASSVSRLERSLSLIAWRDTREQYMQRVVERAGVDISRTAAWLLVQLAERPAQVGSLAQRYGIERPRVDAARQELAQQRYIAAHGADGGAEPRYRLTGEGCAVLDRLVEARRAHLTELMSEWSEERRSELAAAVARLARELVPEREQG